jgi:hypothetical protein
MGDTFFIRHFVALIKEKQFDERKTGLIKQQEEICVIVAIPALAIRIESVDWCSLVTIWPGWNDPLCARDAPCGRRIWGIPKRQS